MTLRKKQRGKKRGTLSLLPLEMPQGIPSGSFTTKYIQLHGLLQRMSEDEELRRRVHNNCRIIMLARDVASYRDLAEKIGVKKPTISMFFSRLRGRQTVHLFMRISAFLGVEDPLDIFKRDFVHEGARALNADGLKEEQT